MISDRARVSVAVSVPPPLAFKIFTADIDRWWRHGLKFRQSPSPSSLLRIEPAVGGRLFESFERDGVSYVLEVGRVAVWEPPAHLRFTWRNVNFTADEHSQVDVEFAPITSGTLVTVTHSGLSALRADHPARHGLQGADYIRMVALWWGEQMSSLRLLCARSVS